MRSIGAQAGESSSYNARVLFFLSRQHRLAYLQMPKAACTSIRTALCLLNHPELEQEKAAGKLQIHSHPEWNDMVGEGSPEIAGFLRFTFVRDPYARFISFYHNKIVGKLNDGPVERFRKLGYTPGMTLDQVLDLVERTPESELDPHLLPQSRFLIRGGRLQVDFIGRLERFAQDLALVETWSGTKLDVGWLNQTKKNQPEDARKKFTEAQRRRVARLYANDFELLGYEA
ncbi:sulfotransferase family protein [Verrucomicrobiota bacterium sgz303538]